MPRRAADRDASAPSPEEVYPQAYYLLFTVSREDGGAATAIAGSSLYSGWQKRRIVRSGESIASPFIDLSEYFDLRAPGRYVVRARFGVPPLLELPTLGPVMSSDYPFSVLSN